MGEGHGRERSDGERSAIERVDRLLDGQPGEACAIIDCDGETLSYEAMRAMVAEAAAALAACGVAPGDRVVIAAENGAAFAAAFLAAIRLDAWSVPLNARLGAAEFDRICDHADPRCIVFVTAFSEAAGAHATRLGAARTLRPGMRVLEGAPGEGAGPDDAPAGVAAMVYTSGTTGRPKGVMLSHRSLVFNAMSAARMRGMGPGDQLLLGLPCTHIMALSACLLSVFHAGATLRILPRFTPDAMLTGLAEGATIMPAVPAMYDQMLAALERTGQGIDAPRLRQIGSGGAPLDLGWKRRIEALFGLPLHNSYGMTEAGPAISSTMLGPKRDDGSVGYAFPGCAVRLAGEGTDGVGELQVSGPNVMDGYFRDAEATRAALTDDGYLRTGDLARIDPDGAIHVVGRAKELIIRSGFNVYPAEVETVIAACPGVAQVAVVGRSVPGNEEIVAFVIADDTVSEAGIAAWCEGRLTGYKKPQHVVRVDAFPLTAAGKVRKAELLAAHEGGIGGEVGGGIAASIEATTGAPARAPQSR